MPVPKYDELMKPLLMAVKDGQVYKIKDANAALAQQLNLSAEDTSRKCCPVADKPCIKTGSDGQRPI